MCHGVVVTEWFGRDSVKNLLLVLSGGLCLLGCENNQREEETSVPTSEFFDLVNTPVGKVDFKTGCNSEGQKLVERGVALIHHMMYEEANFVFGMADNADPDCALAYWGQAMSIINPLWPTTPSDELLQRGNELVAKGMMLENKSERETAYLQTTAAYFENAENRTEKERLASFHAAWEKLANSAPEDSEARMFYSLASLAVADPKDRSLAKQRAVGEELELFLETNPDHPGAMHYLIHVYDYPELAEEALPVADHYGEITPKIPHATHMMTHIYTRLGLWEKAIEWNDLSAQSALSICTATGSINGHYTHALDYLAYAYLQKANNDAVVNILEKSQALQPPYSGNQHASAYAFSAIPARFALERRDWEAASKIEPRVPETFPWTEAYDPYIAISHFARAIGLARSGQLENVDSEISSLRTLKENVAKRNAYWAEQIEVQVQSAKAWQLYASGDVEEGLSRMQAAAELAQTTEKHPITPGEVLPAMELYGDMLIDANQYDEALSAYKISLDRSPNRLNSLHGAAKAAAESDKIVEAIAFYDDILRLADAESAIGHAVAEARSKLVN